MTVPIRHVWVKYAGMALAAVLLLVLVQGASAAPDREFGRVHRDDTSQEADAATDAPAAATYTYTIDVPDENGIKDQVLASSRLVSLQDSPPPTLAALKRRASDDAERFDEVMRSAGYYESDIQYEVTGESAPYDVSVSIAPGERFVLAAYDIVFAGGPPEHAEAIPTDAEVDAGIGGPAVANDIVSTDGRVLRWLRAHGYPYAEVVDRLALANYADRNIWVQLTIDAGPLIHFGRLEIEGLERSEPELVERNVDWQVGEVYDQSQVDAMRNRLIDTGVFSSVVITPQGDAADGAGERTMNVALEEGPPRSIGVGLSYETNLGPEVRFSWEHRNLFGEAERLSIRTTVGQLRQRVDTLLRKPDFLQRDQDLILSSNLVNEQTDAFDRTGIESAAMIERPLWGNWRGSTGIASDFFRISNNDGPGRSLLFGVPVNLFFDNSNNLLNPTRGFRLTTNVTPWAGHADSAVQFLSTEVTGTAYQPLDEARRIVVAVRGQVGTIWGSNLSSIPANRRFYAGGGGSVRGYEYQRLGPLDADNNPIGGKSTVVFGTELRLMVTEDIGIVPFVEAGNVYESTRPDFSEPFFWGTGLGLRYLTPVGPVRFDVAVPLDRRKNIDDAFQFYISLGQAF